MAMNVDRVVNAAHDAYWPNVRARLLAKQIPESHIAELKQENRELIQAILNAMVNEIQQYAETKVTENLETTISALKSGSTVPQDGGATYKSTVSSALPTSTTKRIV